MKMNSKNSIKFGTEGWRGIIARDFTFENVEIVSIATAKYLREKYGNKLNVAISYDRRFLSEDFAKFSADVFKSCGLSIHLSSSFTPTPALSYYVNRKNFIAGIMITASHNPYFYNGFKVKAPHGGPVSEEEAQKISILVNSVMERGREIFSEGSQGKIEMVDLKDFYISGLMNLVEAEIFKKRKMKVFVDPIHGSGTGYLSSVLNFLHQNVEEIRNHRDPLFGEGKPEPTENNLQDLKKLCREFFAVGFALDGDADRIAGVDENGNYVDSHHCFALILKHLVEHRKKKGGVVKTITTSRMIDKLCKIYNLQLFVTPVGFKHASAIMSDGRAFIGGEESGGIGFLDHIPERDGSACALLLLEMMCLRKKYLFELVDELHGEIGYHAYRRIDLEGEKGEEIFEEIEENPHWFAEKIGAKLSGKMDGFKFEYEDGNWLLVRKSGTESIVRIYCEAESKERVDDILGKFMK